VIGASFVSKLTLAFPAATNSREALTTTWGLLPHRRGHRAAATAVKDTQSQATISEKERTVRYAKPKLAVLGEAVRLIEAFVKSHTPIYMDNPVTLPGLNPAYDLDE
jgi:hypothetical protein